jgi:hypothetical protein
MTTNARKNVLATKEELDKFEEYLFEMDDVLERFCSEAKAQGMELDYSVVSLDRLESLIAGAMNGELSEARRDELKSRSARYLGEVFRKHLGGRWELCLKDPKYLYFKLPVIAGYARVPIEFCPIEIVANFTHSRRSGLIRLAVEANAEWKV